MEEPKEKRKEEKILKLSWAEESPHSTESGTDSEGMTGQELLEQLLVTVVQSNERHTGHQKHVSSYFGDGAEAGNTQAPASWARRCQRYTLSISRQLL